MCVKLTARLGYAALPKLAVGDSSFTPNGGPASRSADDLIESMHLPVRPDQMTDEAELEELTEKMRQIEFDAQSQESVASSSSSRSANQVSANDMFDERYTPPGSMIGSDVLQKFHANLEARLHPFWASTLGSRKVHLAVYAANPNTPDFFKSPPIGSPESDEEAAFYRQPIASVNVVTSPDGSFQAVFTLEWARMCQHPAALHIAFGDPDTEHSLYVTADLMPPPSRPPSPNHQPSYPTYAPRASRKLAPTASTTLDVPITHTSVRLISDIDDTIKISGILSGARATFYNVFVKDLGDLIVPGMGEWYTEMWKRGVRFHYVVRITSSWAHTGTYDRSHPVKRALRTITSRRRVLDALPATSRVHQAEILRWSVTVRRSTFRPCRTQASRHDGSPGQLL